MPAEPMAVEKPSARPLRCVTARETAVVTLRLSAPWPATRTPMPRDRHRRDDPCGGHGDPPRHAHSRTMSQPLNGPPG